MGGQGVARAEVKVSARVVLEFGSAAQAKAVGAALAVDNPSTGAAQNVEAKRVLLHVDSGAVGSVRETLDDWLRCAAAAQGSAAAGAGSGKP
jgi:tRNA threonylcarbamoyladenosine modification (KEOPS) complex  Pcc1 subunit